MGKLITNSYSHKMQTPFSETITTMANSMGIALYQRFSMNEASLFLRCSESEVKSLLKKKSINFVQVTPSTIAFFGYQLLEYLEKQTTYHTRRDPLDSHSSDRNRIIRAKEIQELTGLSRTTLWRLENKGKFPRRVSLGANSVGWQYQEVINWISKRP